MKNPRYWPYRGQGRGLAPEGPKPDAVHTETHHSLIDDRSMPKGNAPGIGVAGGTAKDRSRRLCVGLRAEVSKGDDPERGQAADKGSV